MYRIGHVRGLLVMLTIARLAVATVGAPPATAEATVVSSNVDAPYNDDRPVPCANGGAGEIVRIAGTLHIVTHSTLDARGGLHDIDISLNAQGITGVGLTTGDKYQITGGARLHTNGGGASTFETQLIDTFRAIGPGPNNNFRDHFVIHLTVNANGVTTAEVNYGSVTCNEHQRTRSPEKQRGQTLAG